MLKKVNDIVDHVFEITGDAEFASGLKEKIEGRKIIRKLSALRNKAGLSESELGERLGWSSNKVSTLEHSKDNDVSLGEVMSYITALGYEIEFKEITNG
jgi:DNA-binding XRE family transcriptional regulator